MSVNYQFSRFSDGSVVMADAMHRIAPKIVDYRDYAREQSALSQEAFEEGRLLHGRALPPVRGVLHVSWGRSEGAGAATVRAHHA